MQKKQDEEAGAIHEEVAVQRSVAKSSSYYTNTGWDLVDAVDNGNAKLSEIPGEKLPANMIKRCYRSRISHPCTSQLLQSQAAFAAT